MHIGETLIGGASVYTLWLPRQGDNVIFAIEVIQRDSCDLTVEVWEKDEATTGDGAAITGTSTTISANEIKTITVTGVKELVRLKLTATDNGGATSAPFVIHRVLSPIWYDTAKA